MLKRTPPIYTTGKWEIDLPFTIDRDSVYICKAIKSFEELVFSGVDPYEIYYEPYGISLAKYNIDKSNLASIVTLMSDNQSTLFVPDSYILSFPDTTSIPYIQTVLSLSMGALPDNFSLLDLKSQIEQLVLDRVGVTTVVQEHVSATVSKWITQIDHNVIENNRKSLMLNNQSDNARILLLESKNTLLIERNNILEKIIKDNNLLD